MSWLPPPEIILILTIFKDNILVYLYTQKPRILKITYLLNEWTTSERDSLNISINKSIKAASSIEHPQHLICL